MQYWLNSLLFPARSFLRAYPNCCCRLPVDVRIDPDAARELVDGSSTPSPASLSNLLLKSVPRLCKFPKNLCGRRPGSLPPLFELFSAKLFLISSNYEVTLYMFLVRSQNDLLCERTIMPLLSSSPPPCDDFFLERRFLAFRQFLCQMSRLVSVGVRSPKIIKSLLLLRSSCARLEFFFGTPLYPAEAIFIPLRATEERRSRASFFPSFLLFTPLIAP